MQEGANRSNPEKRTAEIEAGAVIEVFQEGSPSSREGTGAVARVFATEMRTKEDLAEIERSGEIEKRKRRRRPRSLRSVER